MLYLHPFAHVRCCCYCCWCLCRPAVSSSKYTKFHLQTDKQIADRNQRWFHINNSSSSLKFPMAAQNCSPSGFSRLRGKKRVRNAGKLEMPFQEAIKLCQSVCICVCVYVSQQLHIPWNKVSWVMIPMLFGYLKRGEKVLQHLTDMGERL